MATGQAADDTAQTAAVLSDFLAAVSFPAVARPDYPSMRGLFCEGAQLIKNSADIPEISTVDEFIRPRQQQVDSGELASFEEIEVADVTEVFETSVTVSPPTRNAARPTTWLSRRGESSVHSSFGLHRAGRSVRWPGMMNEQDSPFPTAEAERQSVIGVESGQATLPISSKARRSALSA